MSDNEHYDCLRTQQANFLLGPEAKSTVTEGRNTDSKGQLCAEHYHIFTRDISYVFSEIFVLMAISYEYVLF